MMKLIKNLLPLSVLKSLRPLYHGVVALFYNYYYGNPSKKLFVIGITGTAGKTTTAFALQHILNQAGEKSGMITTAGYSINNNFKQNKINQTMPSGKLLHKWLAKMVPNGCKFAIIEVTSEGLTQNRHLGIEFDASILTNLSKAHLDSHGGFENYLKAKQKLFKTTKQGKKLGLDRFVLFNADSENLFKIIHNNLSCITLSNKENTVQTQKFTYQENILTTNNISTHLQTQGKHNAYNTALAVKCASLLGIPIKTALEKAQNFTGAPGRMEYIANDLNLNIIVDYACTEDAFVNILQTVRKISSKNLIHVFGMAGGLRDKDQRSTQGQISAKYSDIIIATNEDAYDSNLQQILDDIEKGALQIQDKKPKIIKIKDRKEAIRQAVNLSTPGDTILITGKGSEQFHILEGNIKVDWDDRAITREVINDFIHKHNRTK